MTLTVHDKLTQGSDEWHDVRRGIVTASVVGKLITPKTVKPAANPESHSLTLLLAAERITGWTEPTYTSDDMWRGIEDEPIARDWYSEHHTPVAEVGFMAEDRFGFTIGYSPDGLVGDDGLIEVKSRRSKGQVLAHIEDAVPIENMAQLQCGLLVSGRKWIDYVSWCGGLPPYVKRVEPDRKWFDEIVEAVTVFEENVGVMVRTYQRNTAGLPTTERNPILTAELKL